MELPPWREAEYSPKEFKKISYCQREKFIEWSSLKSRRLSSEDSFEKKTERKSSRSLKEAQGSPSRNSPTEDALLMIRRVEDMINHYVTRKGFMKKKKKFIQTNPRDPHLSWLHDKSPLAECTECRRLGWCSVGYADLCWLDRPRTWRPTLADCPFPPR